jgi:soluble lytic murein transglycosylase-like protein
MRLVAFACVGVLAAGPLAAQVRLTVKKDGTKVIYNVGAGPAAGQSDWGWLAKQRNRRSGYDEIIDRHASKYGVDPVLVRAVIQVESNFNPRCVSNKGARGLMQLIPETARRYGTKDIFDPDQNVRAGVRYLADLLQMFGNDLPRALAAYNAGEGAVTRYGGIPPYDETATYVKRALTVYYGRPYGSGQGSGSFSFAGRKGGPKLRGGFGAAVMQPIALMPGMRYLGSR